MIHKRLNIWAIASAMLLLLGGVLFLSSWGSPSQEPAAVQPQLAATPTTFLPTQPTRPLTEYTFPSSLTARTQGRSQTPTPATTPATAPPQSPVLPSPRPKAQASQPTPKAKPPAKTQARASSSKWPRQVKAAVHPTNYGDRLGKDIHGRSIDYPLLVVLHETVGSAMGTVNFFQVPHYQDEEQASYHALITLNGTIVYLVPPEKRAFGAGNSIFYGPHGPETVQTNPKIPASVNNFAYHISLETPPDGENGNPSHSGYTDAQYQSLAWLVARTRVPNSRITTHKAIDQSGERQDPRSFDFDRLFSLLQDSRSETVARSATPSVN